MQTKLNTYSFTVKDSFFPQSFSGTIEATTIQAAETEVREIYAHELDTTEDDLTVTIELVK